MTDTTDLFIRYKISATCSVSSGVATLTASAATATSISGEETEISVTSLSSLLYLGFWIYGEAGGGLISSVSDEGVITSLDGWYGDTTTDTVVFSACSIPRGSAVYNMSANAIKAFNSQYNAIAAAVRSVSASSIAEAYTRLDCMLSCYVTSMSLSEPPNSPASGDTYIVPSSATGDWEDKDGTIAYMSSSTWYYFTPFTGMTLYNEADSKQYRYTGSAWEAYGLYSTDVDAGTYTQVTVTSGGLVSSGSNPTTLSGYGITDAISSSLTQAYVLIGNASGIATQRQITGDISLAASGATTVSTIGGSTVSALATSTNAAHLTGTIPATVLPSSGVTAGTYSPASVTVDAKGRVTAAESITVSVSEGGTGATTATAARTNLGLGIPDGRVMVENDPATTLKRMDAYAGGWRFISTALTTPPDSPSDGDTYLVADSATGDWADEDGKIAHHQDGDWMYLTPVTGMLAYNAADGLYYRYTGSAWTADLAVLGNDASFSSITTSGSSNTITIASATYTVGGGVAYFAFATYAAFYVNGETPGSGTYSLALWGTESLTLNYKTSVNGHMYPAITNSYTCGKAANAWSGGYTETEFTITSDKRYKTIIERLKADPSLCKFAYALGGNITVFQLNTAIKNKTSASARYHIGLIAQEVESLAETYSIDLDKYGLYCYDDTYDTTTVVKDSDGKMTDRTTSESEDDALSADTDGVTSSTDENGTVTLTSTDTDDDGSVTTITTVHTQRYSLRYQEIAMLMAGAQYLANEAFRESLSLTVDDMFPDTTDSDSST